MVGLLEWSESGQTAATTFVCSLYWQSALFIPYGQQAQSATDGVTPQSGATRANEHGRSA